MVEGWALYCEQLLDEAGYYRTPEQRLFQLVNLLWRAIRVVLDVGLHTRGHDAGRGGGLHGGAPADRAAERRGRGAPLLRVATYQLCYAVGRRELLQLREDWQEATGPDFDPRRFHDTLLSYGGLPVSLARWGMDMAG